MTSKKTVAKQARYQGENRVYIFTEENYINNSIVRKYVFERNGEQTAKLVYRDVEEDYEDDVETAAKKIIREYNISTVLDEDGEPVARLVVE